MFGTDPALRTSDSVTNTQLSKVRRWELNDTQTHLNWRRFARLPRVVMGCTKFPAGLVSVAGAYTTGLRLISHGQKRLKQIDPNKMKSDASALS